MGLFLGNVYPRILTLLLYVLLLPQHLSLWYTAKTPRLAYPAHQPRLCTSGADLKGLNYQ